MIGRSRFKAANRKGSHPMISPAKTVAAYLASLPDDRRHALSALRALILKNLDKDYEEGMQYGMIGYYVPHKIFPQGYHCDPSQPLTYAGLASQKNHMALYLTCVYGHSETRLWFQQAFKKAGKKLDMGKSCVRFKNLEDLPLDIIAQAIRRVPARKYAQTYQTLRAAHQPTPRKKTKKQTRQSKPKKNAQ